MGITNNRILGSIVLASTFAIGSSGCVEDFGSYEVNNVSFGGEIISFENIEKYGSTENCSGILQVIRPGKSLEKFEISGVSGNFRRVTEYCVTDSSDFLERCVGKRKYTLEFDSRAKEYLDKILDYKLSKLGLESVE